MLSLNDDILEELKQEILNWQNDYHAENISSYLLSRGVKLEQIIWQNLGASKRSYRKDVSGFSSFVSDYDNNEYLLLDVNREGIYDALPEGIFHQPLKSKSEKNNQEAIQEIVTHKQQESDARKFFRPFETELQNLKILLNLSEKDFENFDNGKIAKVFEDQFTILKKLGHFQSTIFFRLIPLIHVIRDDFKLIEECLALLLPGKFEVKEVYGFSGSGFVGANLNDCFLGQDMLTGGFVNDGAPDLQISIELGNDSEMETYIEGAMNDQILNELLDYFVGINYNILKEVNIKNVLASQNQLGNLVLGYNSVIDAA